MTKLIKVFSRPADMAVSVGDALFLNGNSEKVFAKPSAYSSTPSGWTFVGVVFNRSGNTVKILDKTAVSRQYKTSNTSDGNSDSSYMKKSGATTNYRGIMNVARGVAFWSSNGRTPSADVPIVENGNQDPVNKSSFDSSSYCKLLRQTYADYESYIRENYGVLYPQSYGVFNTESIPDGKTTTYAYNDSEHPAFQYCASVGYGVDGLAAGDWFMAGVQEGCELMEDSTLALVASTMSKFGGSAPNNSSSRWFAQRGSSNDAWSFNGSYGGLDSNLCTYEFTVQAVALLKV